MRKPDREVRPGFPLSVTLKTRSGHWICFDANRRYYELTGFWSDQFTRRIVGFAVHRGVVDGVALCRMFNRAIHTQALPKYLRSDHDPLYRFHQWQANLHVLAVQEIKPIWRTNSGTFRIISIHHVFTRAWEDDCQILRRRGRH